MARRTRCKHCHEEIHLHDGSWVSYAETRDGNTGELISRTHVEDCGFLHDKVHEPLDERSSSNGDSVDRWEGEGGPSW